MATTLGKTNSGAAFGRSIPRVEAQAKVTGKAEYVHNLRLPGMLYGKVHRSTVAHGRIRGIDVSAAKALSGHASQAGDIVHRIRARLARREPVLEASSINTLVTHAVALLQRDLKRAGVEVSVELDTNLPPVHIDRIGIEQVVSNLLRNAGDAMAGNTGSKHIHVRTCLSLKPPLSQPPGWVTVEVCDLGTGLGGRDIETLTEPFFSTKREGTGLGLAICRSILESHGGVLYAQDAPIGGAQFSFSLPPDIISMDASPS